ncbi:MAG TPA: SRPBCC family protein [Gaiellaceae bacterium]|nr:SRPBCC family protein [Gaiellaceae bacterium]
MNQGKLRSEGDRAGVRFERRYEASPEEVWSALTEPERLTRWLANVAEVDLRVGGRFVLVWNEGDENHRDDGRIRALEPGRLLELDWTYPGEPDSVARFELRPDGDGTILVLDHRGLPPAAIAGYGAGWHSHLDSLDAHLAGSEADWDARFEELGPTYEESARLVQSTP